MENIPVKTSHPRITGKQAILKSLEILGGRASRKDIFDQALILVTDLAGLTPVKTLTTELIHLVEKKQVLHSPNKPRGWYELPSFQEEIARLREEVVALKAENEALRKRQTAEDFIDKLLNDSFEEFKLEAEKIKPIRSALFRQNCKEAVARIDKWYNNKNKVAPYVNHADQLNVQCDVKHH